MLLHALYERLCIAPLNRLPCYGALEVIVTLLLLLLNETAVIMSLALVLTTVHQTTERKNWQHAKKTEKNKLKS